MTPREHACGMSEAAGCVTGRVTFLNVTMVHRRYPRGEGGGATAAGVAAPRNRTGCLDWVAAAQHCT